MSDYVIIFNDFQFREYYKYFAQFAKWQNQSLFRYNHKMQTKPENHHGHCRKSKYAAFEIETDVYRAHSWPNKSVVEWNLVSSFSD